MKCELCKRSATVKNQLYHTDSWLCTYHANKAKERGRIQRKIHKAEGK